MSFKHIVFTCVFVVLLNIIYNILIAVPPLPTLEETWWGSGNSSEEHTEIRPFKVNISDKVLEDLQIRLKNTRVKTPSLEGVQQQYGIHTDLLNEVVEFWNSEYNWKESEKYLNSYPQFTTNIQGLNIHFIHVKPKTNRRVLPLLMLHGWPGSIREFYEIIPLLTTPQKEKDFVFELIIPSLPGFGFSQAALRPGLGSAQVAVIFKNLMKRLGHEKYYLQGGDWGSFIISNMARLFPENVLGLHSNMCYFFSIFTHIKIILGSIYPRAIISEEQEHKLYPITKTYSNLILESGYMHIQSTKPDTIGVALTDSPAGLAGYILEKFTTATNLNWRERVDGGLKEKFTFTKLLDNVMIYWVTGSITTAMRLYAETLNQNHFLHGLDRAPIEVPSACVRFKHEPLFLPNSLLGEVYRNLVHSTDYPNGGHFAALEVPHDLATDIFEAIHKIEGTK